MNSLRIIKNSDFPGSMNMSIDSVLLEGVRKNYQGPILRFYSWSSSCVSVGYSQIIEKTVNVDNCKKDRVDIIRRVTGGGTVFHDEEITYSLIISEKDINVPVPDSFMHLLHPIIETLNDFKIPAKYKPVNDIIVYGKKISGNSQIRRKGFILQHGTIIINHDTDKMFKYIRKKENGLLPLSLRDIIGVTALSYSFKQELEKKLTNGFAEKFCLLPVENGITKTEINLACKINEKIFKCIDWTQGIKKFNIKELTETL